jgi:hypothetical protein
MGRIEIVSARVSDFNGIVKLVKDAGLSTCWEGVADGVRVAGFGLSNCVFEIAGEEIGAFFSGKPNSQELGIYLTAFDFFEHNIYDYAKKLDSVGISHTPCTRGVYPPEADTEGRSYEWDLFLVDTKDTPGNRALFIEYSVPVKSLGKNLVSSSSPITLVEYVVGVPDVAAALSQYSKLFQMEPAADGTFRLDEMIFRITEGTAPKAVVKSTLPQEICVKLAAAIPGLVFV